MFEKREQIEEFFDKIFNSINENAKNQLGCDSSLVENFFRSLKNIKSNNLEVFDKLDSQNSKNYKFPYFINKEISTNFKNELGKIIVLNFDISQELLNAISLCINGKLSKDSVGKMKFFSSANDYIEWLVITQLVDEKKGYYLDLTDPSENIIDEITIDWFDGIDRSVFSRLSKLIEIERVQKICFTHKNATNHPNNLFDVFVKLQSLEIDSCNYSTLDKNFLNGLHIESLYISNCQPVFNPDLFENIKLKTLSITANNIKEVKDINLNNMENLDYLNLMYNKIQTISKNDFNNFSFLKQLNLSGNRIEIIEHNSFDHLIYLEDLILSRNLLTHLNSQMFKKNKNLKTLDISNNENLCSHDILKDLNVENFSIFNTKINYKSIDLQQLRCFAIGSVESSIDLKNLSGFSFIVNELFPENVFMKRNQLKKVVIQIKSNFDLDNLNLNHLNGLNQVEELGLKIQSFNQSKWESKSKIFEDIFDVNQFKTHFYLNALTGSAEISITSMAKWNMHQYGFESILDAALRDIY